MSGLAIQPLVSVLMPSLNQETFISDAIESVLSQSHGRIELLVADGGSDDGSLDVIDAMGRSDSRLRWFSGQDTGPAEALNLALAKARGTVISWLNSDDLYTQGAVARAVDALAVSNYAQMVYGHGEHIDVAGRVLGNYPTLPPSTPYSQFAKGCFICQPTVFFRRTMPLLLGPFDQSLKTAFDFDYWLRAFQRFKGRIGFVNEVQAQSRLHEACITRRQRRTVMLEGMSLLAKHLGYAPKEWLLTYVAESLEQTHNSAQLAFLKKDVSELLVQVEDWLKPDDLRELKRILAMPQTWTLHS